MSAPAIRLAATAMLHAFSGITFLVSSNQNETSKHTTIAPSNPSRILVDTMLYFSLICGRGSTI